MSPLIFRALRAFVFACLFALSARANPIITEFMADNVSFIADEDGDYSDWIEIHNPGAAAVNLTDWALTDDNTNLTKWKFPAVTMQPGDFLVVWASGKNKRVVGSPLHTNFSLAKGGEYLALIQPDGTTIEQQFAPAFPAMDANESYGLQFTTTNFISAGAPARFLVPSSTSTSWTLPGFNADSPPPVWGSGNTGLGFGLLVPGITVRQVLPSASFLSTYGGVNSVATSTALLGASAGSGYIANEETINAGTVNFLGDGSDAHYGSNLPLPVSGEPYALLATGYINITTAGTYTFGLNSDDGGRIKIDSTYVMTDDSNHGPEDNVGHITLTKGLHSFEVLFWEGGGGDEVEFYAGIGNFATWQSTFRLVGDTANGGLAASTVPVGAGSNVVTTNISAQMLGVRSSCYVRVPFTATGPGTLTSLSLKMRYNDGYIAYLNGSTNVIAQRNAPVTPAFNSIATATRSDADSLVVDPVNVTSFLSKIVNGNNVLAIQGFNIGASDGSFLVLPELIGGTLNAGAQAVFFDSTKATPGSINGPYSLLGKIEDTAFSTKRGFYTSPFQLAITTTTPGVTIRYTTDRSTPSETNGIVYTGPITIGSTTVVRAVAFKTGYQSTNVDTQTYIFTADVITQSPTGAPTPGWPVGPINGQVLDYGMDQNIVNNADPTIGGPTVVQNSLKAISTISLVTDQFNLTDPTTGIYVNPGDRGFSWERAGSMEMINPPDATHPNGTSEFHVNCGLRVRGGYSRSSGNPKHGWHIYFRSDYGDSKLNYPLFGRFGADTFDQIDLRTSENYSWAFSGDPNNTYLREECSRMTQIDMGDLGSHVRYVQLYVNGQYFGLYDFDERTEASFGATYLPGSKDDFDVVKCEQESGYTTNVTDGNLTTWQNLWTQSRAHYFNPTNANYYKMQGKAADGVTPTADPVLLDVDDLIDYMMLTFWHGNLDGSTSAFLGNETSNNWFGMRNRTGNLGFKFFVHDAEHTFFSTGEDRTGPFSDPSTGNWNNFSYSCPMFLHQDLMPNAEYKIRWADRIQKIMFNGGPMSPEQFTARFNRLAAIVDTAIIAESARWGDAQISPARNRVDWFGARDYILNSYIPFRTSVVLGQLRADGLYPALDAPILNPAGGNVANNTEVVMSVPVGVVVFMADGSDPRLIGGAAKAGFQIYTSSTTSESLIPLGAVWKYKDDGSNQGTAWRNVGFNDAAWASGPAELGYGDGDEATVVNGGPTATRFPTTYFRRTFTVSSPTGISASSLHLRYDDAAAVYINGVEVVRTAGLPADPAYNFYASSVNNENAEADFTINPSVFVNGANTIAAEVHQRSGDSSDVSFNLSLTASRVSTPTHFILTGNGEKHARVRAATVDAGNNVTSWGALVDATYLIDTDPASAANLAISEIMYHPADPSAAEIAAGFIDADDFEFVEFTNIGSHTIDLSGLYLYGSIDFDFANSLIPRTLPVGGKFLLVSNKAAFDFRYGAGQPIAGQYGGNLNNGGEEIVLYNSADAAISDVTYGTAAGWPPEADGGGYSLVRINPDGTYNNDNDPAHWRHSTTIGGNPGGSDAMTYAAWKTANNIAGGDTADGDGDGLGNALEYTLGGIVPKSDTARMPKVGLANFTVLGVTNPYATLTFTRRFAADDATYAVQTNSSLNPATWMPNGVFVSTTPNGDGTDTVIYRAPNPQLPGGLQLFLRLKTQIGP